MPARKTAYLSHVIDMKIVIRILAAKIKKTITFIVQGRIKNIAQDYCPVGHKFISCHKYPTESKRISKENL